VKPQVRDLDSTRPTHVSAAPDNPVGAQNSATGLTWLAFTGFPRAIWRQIWSNNPNG